MHQPRGFEVPSEAPLVCKLDKALYGLKQASRSWFFTIRSVLLQLGFKQSVADTSLFHKLGSSPIFLLIYVDVILLTGQSSLAIQLVIEQLSYRFSLKNLGFAYHFLGIEITRTSNGLHLSQHQYAQDILGKQT